jgi:acetolactate synthase-1/2/3 large subunit
MEGHGGLFAAEVLARHGVEVVFTLSGGHLFPLYDGCVQRGIRIVDTRHEQTAGFAAEAWAKLTRRPGVAALTAGPGVTNGMSAITSAWLNGSPVTVIGGRAPQNRWGAGSLQELDHVPIVASVTKHAATATDTVGIGDALHRALVAASTPHRGPAFLDIPMDVFFSTGSGEVPAAPAPAGLRGAPPDTDAVAAVAKLFREARRPVLMIGADVYWDGAEMAMQRFADAARIPVFFNGLGRGTIPADHDLAFSRSRSVAFKGADLVIVAGSPLDFRLGFGRFGEAAVVHLADASTQIAGHVALAASIAGDLTATFDALTAECSGANGATERDEWIAQLRGDEQARRAAELPDLESGATPIHPARIYGELRGILDRDAVVIGDGGDFVSYAGKFIDTFTPGCFLDPGPYGCLGAGVGAAIAARLAHPDRQVVLLLGDGAAGFALADFDTLVRFSLPVVAIVGNNGIWGLEKHPMRAIYGYDVAAELQPETRYDLVVEALGGRGELVRDPRDIGPAIRRALDSGVPSLVNVLTDPENVYPRSSNLG